LAKHNKIINDSVEISSDILQIAML